MIKITLEYTSIDDAITAMALLRGSKLATDTSLVVKDAAAPAAKDKATGKSDGATDKKTSTAPAADAKPSAAEKKADAQPTPPTASTSPTGYGIVADKIAMKAKTHRAEVVALLKKYGAASGKELKAEDYEKFVGEIDEIGKPADDDLA